MRDEIIQGSVLDAATWEPIPDQHVQCCITSPPYWGLRDYGTAEWEGGDQECDHMESKPFVNPKNTLGPRGHLPSTNAANKMHQKQYAVHCEKCGALRHDKQVGMEPTPEEYVAKMVEVFSEVRRVLRDDGTLWLNLGDSYASQGGANPHTAPSGTGNNSKIETAQPARTPPAGLKPKDLCGIPWRVALALQADGWYLRQDIIWHKPNPMPESVRDRCTKAHEYLFLLTKKPRYFCDMEAIREPVKAGCDGTIRARARTANGALGGENRHHVEERVYKEIKGANRRSVWTVATKPYKEAHFATFPPKLIEPCVLAGTSAEGQCPECGKPWVRVVEKGETTRKGPVASGWREPSGRGNMAESVTCGTTERKTIGWRPDCECDPVANCAGGFPPIPQIVLDPFMGSGTTGMVARQHGRDYLGIELNPEYAKMARERIAVATEPGYVSQDIPDDAPLFV
jgi:DNA modification methylase